MSIFPDIATSGAVVYRDIDGNPLNPPNVQNAYSPPASFVINCPATALPSDCDARIEAKQINGIVSELLAFAVCLDPDGPWDCNSLSNLCTAFAAWMELHSIFVSPDPPATPSVNTFWWNNETGVLSLYYDDGGDQQWVQANGTVVDQTSIIGTGFADLPLSVGVIDCGTY